MNGFNLKMWFQHKNVVVYLTDYVGVEILMYFRPQLKLNSIIQTIAFNNISELYTL